MLHTGFGLLPTCCLSVQYLLLVRTVKSFAAAIWQLCSCTGIQQLYHQQLQLLQVTARQAAALALAVLRVLLICCKSYSDAAKQAADARLGIRPTTLKNRLLPASLTTNIASIFLSNTQLNFCILNYLFTFGDIKIRFCILFSHKIFQQKFSKFSSSTERRWITAPADCEVLASCSSDAASR